MTSYIWNGKKTCCLKPPTSHGLKHGLIWLWIKTYYIIPFLGEWTSIYQLFWCELQGYKVLTHCHMLLHMKWAWNPEFCCFNSSGFRTVRSKAPLRDIDTPCAAPLRHGTNHWNLLDVEKSHGKCGDDPRFGLIPSGNLLHSYWKWP